MSKENRALAEYLAVKTPEAVKATLRHGQVTANAYIKLWLDHCREVAVLHGPDEFDRTMYQFTGGYGVAYAEVDGLLALLQLGTVDDLSEYLQTKLGQHPNEFPFDVHVERTKYTVYSPGTSVFVLQSGAAAPNPAPEPEQTQFDKLRADVDALRNAERAYYAAKSAAVGGARAYALDWVRRCLGAISDVPRLDKTTVNKQLAGLPLAGTELMLVTQGFQQVSLLALVGIINGYMAEDAALGELLAKQPFEYTVEDASAQGNEAKLVLRAGKFRVSAKYAYTMT